MLEKSSQSSQAFIFIYMIHQSLLDSILNTPVPHTYDGCEEQAEFITYKIVDELIACKKKFTFIINSEEINKYVEDKINIFKAFSRETFVNTNFFNNIKITFTLYTGEKDFKVITSHNVEDDNVGDNGLIDCISINISSVKYSNKYRDNLIDTIKDRIINELIKSWEHYKDKHR